MTLKHEDKITAYERAQCWSVVNSRQRAVQRAVMAGDQPSKRIVMSPSRRERIETMLAAEPGDAFLRTAWRWSWRKKGTTTGASLDCAS